MQILAIIVGAVIWFALGAAWYGALAKPWMAASGLTEEKVKSGNAGVTYGVAMLAVLFGTIMLNQVYGLADVVSFTEALRLGLYIGIGSALVIVTLNVMYGMRGKALIWIDGGYGVIGSTVVFLARYFTAG